jgi:hypothetical protein
MVTRKKFIQEAHEWLETPFLDQQSNKGIGCDCVGLIAGVARNTKAVKNLEFETDYRRSSDGTTMLALFRKYTEEINWRDALPADFFVVRYNPVHWHCMIVAERKENIETEFTVIEAGKEKVIKHRVDSGTKRRIFTAFRIKNIK